VVAVGARVGRGGAATGGADAVGNRGAGDAARILDADDICAGGAPQPAMSDPVSITNIQRITCVMQSSPLVSKFLYDLCIWYDVNVAFSALPRRNNQFTAETQRT
jgi:hypothetical protein